MAKLNPVINGHLGDRIAKFKIKPGKSNPFKPDAKLYYSVHIFATKQGMWSMGNRLFPGELGRYGAIVLPYRREWFEGSVRCLAPKIGDVLFYRDLLGSEVICHESVHLATNYLRQINRLKLNEQTDDNEELLAYCVGSCARQIVDRLYRLEIL